MIDIGPVQVDILNAPAAVEGHTFSDGQQSGTSIPAMVHIPDGGLLEIGLTTWANGEHDIRAFSRLAGPVAYDRLTAGVRQGVHPTDTGLWSCELGILTHHSDRPPTMIKAGWDDLDAVLGASARDLLLDLGAHQVGTKADVLADTGKRRSYLVMTCTDGDAQPALAAYVLTRVLPLFKGFGKQAAVPVGHA